MSYRVIGEVTDKAAFEYGNVSITLDEALKTWDAALEDVSRQRAMSGKKKLRTKYLSRERCDLQS